MDSILNEYGVLGSLLIDPSLFPEAAELPDDVFSSLPLQAVFRAMRRQYEENGGFDASKAQLIAGNFKKLVYSIRQDVTVKLLDQGVIQDPTTKEIVYNLAQQDMVALSVVMRMGWALPNPATRMNADRSKVPFAFLTAAAVAA